MTALVVLPLLLLAAMTGTQTVRFERFSDFNRVTNNGSTGGTWCICKDGVSDTVLQKTLDYACGEGADCNPIHMKGPCFNPDTVRAHCNYSVNSFFQRKGQAQGTCDFASTATLTTSDPSYAGCPFAATASAASTTTTPKTTPSTTTPNVNPINNNPTPYGSTTPTGMLGGVGNGLSPSGSGINPDYSTDDGGFRLQYCFSSNGTLLLSGFMLLWA
ncbi:PLASMODESMATA CALLOSE-BINDING PROTEIN 2 [Hibiscus syriacus]|uniref:PLASMODESMATA CALLOSE-BINDING PROTEIN 2 n=1 Tax=Hibiscus syriacus TaxID=106335 RepID=A0A6A2YPW7_HIBSY|nr:PLASMODESMATA CALLOSE-BINDING PROTEIN 2 [Hibiscus syriacus]